MKPRTHTVYVTAPGVLFPPSFNAAVLAMQRYRQKHTGVKAGELQLTLDYAETTESSED